MLRIGTDCSGIDAPVYALQLLNIPHIHIFSSEIDSHCIKSIKANYKPQIIFGDKNGPYPEGDITKRNIIDVPDIDLYVAGFPCQPFSSAGKKNGFNDPRGTVFWSCLEVIKHKQPTYFILENVKGLLYHEKGNTWSVVIDEIEKLKELGYYIDWNVLNTRDYGIPQNRERIFIIGSKRGIFDWPEKLEMDKLELYIDNSDNNSIISKTILKYKDKIKKNNIFINTDFLKYTSFSSSNKFAPCIGCQNTLYNIQKNRYATVNEYLKLQGFDENFVISVSNTRLKHQIGNSISTNVLVEIYKNLLDI